MDSLNGPENTTSDSNAGMSKDSKQLCVFVSPETNYYRLEGKQLSSENNPRFRRR